MPPLRAVTTPFERRSASRSTPASIRHIEESSGIIRAGSLQLRYRMCSHLCGDSHMATNLSIDPDLLERALEVSGERTKKAAVSKALEEFIARRRQKRLLELMGKLEWDEGFDYKAERSRN